jgi:hypothetical protein
MSTTSAGNANINSVVEEDESKDAIINNHNREKHLNEDNDEIIVIPDLDEEGGADSDQRIAHAPRNVNRRIPTLAELDNDLKSTASSGSSADSDGSLNLSVLLSTLVPASMVYEDPDTLWTFESLLREVTDDLSNTPKFLLASAASTLVDYASNPVVAANSFSNKMGMNNLNSASPNKIKMQEKRK